MRLSNKIAVVTGGLSGLGAATVKNLLDLGAYTAVIDLNLPSSPATSESTRSRYFKADVTNASEVEKAVAGILSWSASSGLEIGLVVCCAGFLGPGKIMSKKGEMLPLDHFKRVLDCNLVGTVDLIRQLVPRMAAQQPDADGNRGVVITVASAAAFDGQEGQVAYSAAKGAIASMTLPLARDLAYLGIRAVCISPGLFETGMSAKIPSKAQLSLQKSLEFPSRAGRAEEFALLVRHVVENDMLNGTVIRLDGASRMPSRL